VSSGLIALRDEAGYQPWILRGGMHWLMPLQYRVHRMPLVTITQGSDRLRLRTRRRAARAHAGARVERHRR
jgi:uncharacterized membrane protein YqiK